MGVGLLLKIAGVGLLVSAACQILQKYGREDVATFVSVAGIISVMFLIIREIDALFSALKSVFAL